MDEFFSPDAGFSSSEFSRKVEILEQASVLIGRVRVRKPEKSILVVGPSGSGKTALLNEIEQIARREGYQTIFVSLREEKPLAELLVPGLKKTLFELGGLPGAGDGSRGLRVLKSFIESQALKIGDIDASLSIEREVGSADTGDLEIDLAILLEAVTQTALEREVQIALLIDDIHYLSCVELSALIMAMHKLQQRRLPLVLFGTGPSTLPKLMGNSQAYAERLFSFPSI
ncbi:hypothetical protein CBP51_03210 [Cellvibrio mixtus]|uniref:AAA+ ATPase domain-containing protein n=1 Tax=Cellvibrio mixtus TaxID=39650 RepID=A0A266Q841_9GAMM|nr:ATP-binding protein [Cellvibrio mixtus]OZY86054.1 hypothetical protein CBP51_03210 [Cellvibrio mixtus]